jgi:hypothetical protein
MPLPVIPALLVLLAILTSACGHKAPPLPPPNMAPQATQDIRVKQRGQEILIDFAYPRVTVSGATLAGLDAVEIWQLVQPVPESILEAEAAEGEEPEAADEAEGVVEAADNAGEPAEEVPIAEEEAIAAETADTRDPEELDSDYDRADPDRDEQDGGEGDEGDGDEESDEAEEEAEESLESLLRADPREFAGSARMAVAFRQPELQSLVVGDRIFLAMPLPDPLPDMPEVYNLAIRTFSSDGRPSQLSKHVVLIPTAPPAPPTGLVATGAADGVALSWDAGPEELVGYRVYRREIRAEGFDQPVGKIAAAAQAHTDRTAQFGHNYAYAVSAVAKEGPLLESALSAIAEIRYEDSFAPSTPTGLVALSGAEGVRLLWEAGRALDLAGYVVYRQERGGEFERITAEPVEDNEFVDAGVSAGRSYTYMVRAIDQAGNLSSPSETIDARP